jgi:hypothetical protein
MDDLIIGNGMSVFQGMEEIGHLLSGIEIQPVFRTYP